MGSRQLSLLYWSAIVPLGMLLIASSGPNWEKKILNIAQSLWKIVSVLQNPEWVSFFSFYSSLLCLRIGNYFFSVRKIHNKLIIIPEVANIQVVQ